MTNDQITIVNNTGADISIVHEHFVAFAKTGELHEDISDTFAVYLHKEWENDYRVIVNFL